MEENLVTVDPGVVTESILALGKGGVMVLIVMLIALIAGLIWMVYKITGNHISHSTKAMAEQTESNRALSGSVDKLGSIIDKKL